MAEKYGDGVVPVPGKTVGYELLGELSRGTNAFDGATKGKRSIADRPPAVYGRLRATRPGEYVLLDTTKLDVFAMEPVTCRWVQAELTAAMDLYDRCITGLRLTPVSTKAVDVAGVLYETIHPRQPAMNEVEALPAHGVPDAVVLDARKLVDRQGRVATMWMWSSAWRTATHRTASGSPWGASPTAAIISAAMCCHCWSDKIRSV